MRAVRPGRASMGLWIDQPVRGLAASVGMTLLLASGLGAAPALAQDCSLEVLDTGWDGQPLTAASRDPFVSADGSRILFCSQASNLVPGDVGSFYDIFQLELATGAVTMVSVSGSGSQGNGWSNWPSLSADNRFAVFNSTADNLDPADGDSLPDIFLRDLWKGTTTLISERLGPGPSAQGCTRCVLSANGRFVAFTCLDDNVVPGDSNQQADVFVRDRFTGLTELVSLGPGDVQADLHCDRVAISADGRYVAFESGASNWWPWATAWGSVNVFVRDRATGTTLPVTLGPSGTLVGGRYPALSADGRWVAFQAFAAELSPHHVAGPEIYVRDLSLGPFEWISRRLPGALPVLSFNEGPAISMDGRFVVWESSAPDLSLPAGHRFPGVFLRDRLTGVTKRLDPSPATRPPYQTGRTPSLSFDGSVIAYDGTSLVRWRECDLLSPWTLCPAGPSPDGCALWIDSTGTPSVSAGTGFVIRAGSLPASRAGVLLYGTRGYPGSPLANGSLCVGPPWRALLVAGTGGANPCGGTLTADFNAWIAAGADPALAAGQAVFVQGWVREPTGSGGLVVTNAQVFLLGP